MVKRIQKELPTITYLFNQLRNQLYTVDLVYVLSKDDGLINVKCNHFGVAQILNKEHYGYKELIGFVIDKKVELLQMSISVKEKLIQKNTLKRNICFKTMTIFYCHRKIR